MRREGGSRGIGRWGGNTGSVAGGCGGTIGGAHGGGCSGSSCHGGGGGSGGAITTGADTVLIAYSSMLSSEAMVFVMLPIAFTVADASCEVADPSFTTLTIASTVLVDAIEAI